MLRSIGKQPPGESVESVLKKKRKADCNGFKEGFKPAMKE